MQEYLIDPKNINSKVSFSYSVKPKGYYYNTDEGGGKNYPWQKIEEKLIDVVTQGGRAHFYMKDPSIDSFFIEVTLYAEANKYAAVGMTVQPELESVEHPLWEWWIPGKETEDFQGYEWVGEISGFDLRQIGRDPKPALLLFKDIFTHSQVSDEMLKYFAPRGEFLPGVALPPE